MVQAPDKLPGKETDMASYLRLLSYVRPLLFFFFLSIIGYFIYATTNAAFAQLLGYIVDSLGGNDPIENSFLEPYLIEVLGTSEHLNRGIIPICIIVIAVMRGIGTFMGNYFIARVSTQVVHRLRCELFDQLLAMPSQFYDQNSFGHLVAKVTYHVTQVTGAATDAVKVVIREGFTVLVLLGTMLYLNWKLTAVFFIVAPFIALLVNYAGRRFRRISERIQNSMGDVTHVATEAVQGYRVVRNFGGASYERERFSKVSEYNRLQSLKMVVTSSISTPVIQVMVAGVMAFLVWILLDPALMENMSAGNVVTFISVTGLLAKPIRQLSEVNETIQKGLAAAKDIFALFDEPVETDLGTLQLDQVKGQVEFRNVSFRYGKDSPLVLKNLNFVAEPGETIAFVGRSGSGKSTLASLIPRFYAPESGEIYIDGVPIEDFTLANLRRHIALVTQQVTLFNDTVRRNIAYGDLEKAPEEDVIEAARRAYALPFIEKLSDGLNTVVGDDGVLLSGGQRQRMALARAFLKDAPLLVLDEATSALDTESEQYIQAALEAVVKDRTTFIIAHRLTTIESADRIFVLDNGEIVEQGNHQQLLAAKGTYANLYQISSTDLLEQVKSPEQTSTLPTLAIEDQPRSVAFPVDTSQLLVNAWYRKAWWLWLLQPISTLFRYLSSYRRRRYTTRPGLRWKAPVPVIVVGNINVGGTGKTPLVIWLANALQDKGYQPGIVSRGYGGGAEEYPLRVTAESDPRLVGDESVMIARRSSCPVVIDPDRVRAVQTLLDENTCDIVISDDGLQHYALDRDIEIVVLDSVRGLGNGLCLPAGPLREPLSRLAEADLLVTNGKVALEIGLDQIKMAIQPVHWVNIVSGETASIDCWNESKTVHAVAGIGNPDRFFLTLRELGFDVIEHAFMDHHSFYLGELSFGDTLPVVMTEKDAVKIRLLNPAMLHDKFWYLKVDVAIEDRFSELLLKQLEERKV